MKRTNIAMEIALGVIWTLVFISNLIKGDISTTSYVIMYLALILEICGNVMFMVKINRE